MEPDPSRHRRVPARRGHQVRSREILDARHAVRVAGAARPRRIAARLPPQREGATGPAAGRAPLRAVARVGSRRQDEHLGPRQPALRGSRFRGTGARRLGSSVAVPLQGHRAVLRPGRSADRRVRRRRRPGIAAGQSPSPAAAGAAVRRAAVAEGGRLARHRHRQRTPRQHDAIGARLCQVPLLRWLRARLRHRVVLLFGRPSAAVRARDEEARAALERRRRPRARRTTTGWRAACSTFDRTTGREQQVRGKVVVVAASCIDSTRLLLNSKSERYPNGIGNGNDVVGRYLCEQFRFHVGGFLPTLYDQPWQSDRGIGEHIYLPRFNYRPEHRRDYLRGFGMQFWNTGRSSAGVDHFARQSRWLRRRPEARDQEALSGVVRGAPLWRGAALRAQPRDRRRVTRRSLRRAARPDRLSHWRQRAPDARPHVRRGRGDLPRGEGGARRTSRAASSTSTGRPSTSTAPAAWAPIPNDRR